MSKLGDAPSGPAGETPAESPWGGDQWSCEEIERLYRQALDAVEAVASDLTSVTRTLSSDPDNEADKDKPADPDATPAAARLALTSPVESSASDPSAVDAGPRAEPEQVIESLLFVGGQPLSAKTICGLLRGDFDAAFVEQAIEEINRRYARQNRPYEIRLGEGGYRTVLRSEYEPLRNRVYGFGPKQVRLSQETLEILALVAYRQPISRKKVEELSGRSAGAALRQLLERGLLVMDRSDTAPSAEPQYGTSARFLQLFGVSRLDELPQIEDLDFK